MINIMVRFRVKIMGQVRIKIRDMQKSYNIIKLNNLIW
jgi:hypothetical protein